MSERVSVFEEVEAPTERVSVFDDVSPPPEGLLNEQVVDPNPGPEHVPELLSDELLYPRTTVYPDFGRDANRFEESYQISQKLGIDFVLADSLYPLLKKSTEDEWKPIEPYGGFVNDVGRTIDETPTNLHIGVLTGGAGLANAFKREGMRWALGINCLPDKIVPKILTPKEITDDNIKRIFEPVEVDPEKWKLYERRKHDPLTKLLRPSYVPVSGEALSVGLRSFDVVARVLNAEASTKRAKQDKIDIQQSPIARAMRGVNQNLPQYGTAIGLGILTGDSAVSLGLLGGITGGQEFAEELEAGGSMRKAMFFGDLNMAAEIGGELLVFPKFIRGLTEGIPIREALGLIALNSGQEGVTQYTQTFLNKFGTLTTKGVSVGEAAKQAHEDGVKSIPEAMWIGGVLSAGPAGVGVVQNQAQYTKQKTEHDIIDRANKDITDIQKRYKKQPRMVREMVRARIARGMRELEVLDLTEEQEFAKEAEKQAKTIEDNINKDIAPTPIESIAGTHNQFIKQKQAIASQQGYEAGERWELEQVEKGKKPAYITTDQGLSKEELEQYAKENLLVFGEKEGEFIVAESQEALNAVLEASNARELGLALGYEDTGKPETKPIEGQPAQAEGGKGKTTPNMAQAGGVASEKLTVPLYGGNLTQGLAKRIADSLGKKPEDVRTKDELGRLIKRYDIEVTRAEAGDLLNQSVNQLDKLVQKVEAGDTLEMTPNELAKIQATVGDIKALQDALGYEVKPAQMTFRQAKKPRPKTIAEMAKRMPPELAKAMNEIYDVPTKEVVMQSVHPTDKISITTYALFKKVMEGRTKEAQHAFVAGAKDTVKHHKNLAALAKMKLKGLDVTDGQRNQLLNAVSRARTEGERIVAMASVESVVDKALKKRAVNNVRQAIKSIPKHGKAMAVRQPAIDTITAALEGVDLTALSKSKRAELEGIQQDLIDVGFDLQQGIGSASEEEVEGIEAVVGEKIANQLRRLKKKPLADMTAEDIQTIADTIQYAVKQNEAQNKFYRNRQYEDVVKPVQKASSELTPTRKALKADPEVSGRKRETSMAQYAGRFFTTDSMKIYALVEASTDQGDSVMRRLLDEERHAGKNKALATQFKALDMVRNELDRLKWSDADYERIDQEHTVTLGGKKYKVTTAEIMSLGMNLRSNRNKGQIVKTKGLFMGRRKVNTPTVSEIQTAMENLTDKEIAFMDFIPNLNEQVLMPAINETSDVLLGFDMARDPFYWGLTRKLSRRMRGQVNTIEGAAIEDIGAFQPFTGGTATLRIRPFWDQLLTQIQNSSSYHGLAIPMKNARTLLNNEAWQDAMVDAGREAEMDALMKIFRRSQGIGSDQMSIDIFGQRLLSASAKSILGYRPSTMLIQPMSIPMAFTIIPNKYAVPGGATQSGKAQSERMDQYSPMLRMRHEGGRTNLVVGDVGAAHAVEGLIFRKVADPSLEGLRKTDRWAIQQIDQSVQRWVSDTTQLKKGSDAYWKEVARRTEDVVRKTQPMWDVDERSVLSSTRNVAWKSMLMFRSAREAMVNQNLVAGDRVLKAPKNKKAWVGAANTFGATLTSTVLVRGIKTAFYYGTTIGAAALLKREPPEELVTTEKLGEALITDMFGHLPMGSVVIGTIRGIMGRQTWNELDPDAILFAPPALLVDAKRHYAAAYRAWEENGNDDEFKANLIEATTELYDAIARFKGYPSSGIMQFTTDPVVRVLKHDEPSNIPGLPKAPKAP